MLQLDMKTKGRLVGTCIVFVACATTAVPLWADDTPDTVSPPKPADKQTPETISLFDGKTLTGWKEISFGAEGVCEVEKGLLVVNQGDPLTGLKWVGKELPKVDYELTFEAQRAQGNDFFCAVTFPVEESHCSLILGGWGGATTGLSTIDGSDASENETSDYASFEDDKWYKVKVRVEQDRIQCWLDKKRIVDVDTQHKEIGIRIEMELGKPLSLCTFATTGKYRKLKIEQLAKARPAAKKTNRD